MQKLLKQSGKQCLDKLKCLRYTELQLEILTKLQKNTIKNSIYIDNYKFLL